MKYAQFKHIFFCNDVDETYIRLDNYLPLPSALLCCILFLYSMLTLTDFSYYDIMDIILKIINRKIENNYAVTYFKFGRVKK